MRGSRRQRGSARGQMQKLSARKFHHGPALRTARVNLATHHSALTPENLTALRPFLGFGGDEAAEFGRRGAIMAAAPSSASRALIFGIGQARH